MSAKVRPIEVKCSVCGAEPSRDCSGDGTVDVRERATGNFYTLHTGRIRDARTIAEAFKVTSEETR